MSLRKINEESAKDASADGDRKKIGDYWTAAMDEALAERVGITPLKEELAQIDGAFIVSADGVMMAAGRHVDASAEGLTLSKGLGARHWAAAAASKQSKAIAIAVSESTGTVRIFQDGYVVLRIEPLERGLKWSELETEPPPSTEL